MRRTSATEDIMSNSPHPHAAFDRFPELVRGLIEEFGAEGIDAIVERFIAAEEADFYWDGRIAERPLGSFEDAFEEGEGARARVVVLGFFRRRYYIATCVVDAARRVCWTQQPRHFDDFESAETAFMADG